MIRSMTGFGKAGAEFDGKQITLELTSVNHRFLDATVRLPPEWAPLDPAIREALKERLSRGKITLNINRKRGAASAKALRFDVDIAKKYIEASHELGHLAGQYEKLTVNTLARLDGVFYHEDSEEDLERARELVLGLLDKTVTQLDAMRDREGEAMAGELSQRLDNIRGRLDTVETRLPELNRQYEEKLRARIRDLAGDTNIAEERIAVEVAMLADKGDVTEETVRLRAHLFHAHAIMADGEPSGRKLNFLTQEIQREINTLGSKVRDNDVLREVLDMKTELEKFREQIQNIE